MIIYTVKNGDTLNSIAKEYGVSLSYLKQVNLIKNDDDFTVGQSLIILYPEQVYTVNEGDTLLSISRKYSVDVNTVLRNNPYLEGKNNLKAGDKIVISFNGEKIGNISVNGYVYPFVDNDELYKVLPFLTYITIFTYGFSSDGNLITKGVSEESGREAEIIRLSYEYGVGPVMHISTLTEEGKFSSELADNLLNSASSIDNLIENSIANMKNKGYVGVDVDFEYVAPENKKKYSDFIDKFTKSVNEEGLFLITALAPKTSSDQKGLLYEAHDYGEIGKNSDYVLLMTYEWGYTYGPPMAVAPLNKVNEVVSYALTEIPNNKIYMGIPNYAYDWTLPFEKGKTKARKLSNDEAIDIAIKNKSTVFFDYEAQTPYFNYNENEIEHVVWFEDASSSQSKLLSVNEYALNGIGIWNLMRFFEQFFVVLNDMFNIKKISL